MNWLRLYHEVLDDPKVQRLEAPVFRAWINLLCLASRSQPRGVLPSIEDIAFALRMEESEARRTVDILVERGLIEHGEAGLAPHNWEARQAKSDDVASRVRKHRAAVTGNVTGNVTAAVTETLPETDAAEEPKRFGNGLDKSREEESREEKRRGDIGADAPPAKVTPIGKSKRATKVPVHFDLDAEHYDAAESLGFTTQQTVDETARFLDWHRSKGSTFVDWQAAWRNWMRKAKEISATRPARGGRMSAAEYAAEFDRALAADGLEVVEVAPR